MTDKKMIVNLDFRTLLFLDVLIMLFMLLSGKAEVTLIAFVIAGTVLMVFGLYSTVIRCTIVFAVLFLYYFAITHSNGSIFQGSLLSVIGIIAFIIQRIIPFLMLAIAIKERKNISEITTALGRCRLPKGVIISMTVMLRYFPSMKNDFLTIIEAMKLKGIDTSWRGILFHPLRMLEYVIVPMLFRSLRTSEELSCAALVKGIENQGQRSSYFDVKVKGIDVIFSSSAFVMLLMSVKLHLF